MPSSYSRPQYYLIAQWFCFLTLIFIFMASILVGLTNPAEAGFCWRDSYGRGAGTIPNRCPSGAKAGPLKLWCWKNGKKVPRRCGGDDEKQGGLCYKSCRTGYANVGPVCWAACPEGWVNCGAGCATNKKACRQQVKEQVVASLNVVLNIVKLATQTKSLDMLEAKINQELLKASKALVNHTRQQIRNELINVAQTAGVQMGKGKFDVDELSNILYDAARGTVKNYDWSEIDPTGIYRVVEAFRGKKCLLPLWAQDRKPAQVYRTLLTVDQDAKASCPRRVVLKGNLQFAEPGSARYSLVMNGNTLIKGKAVSAMEAFNNDAVHIARFQHELRLDPGTYKFKMISGNLAASARREDVKTITISCGSFKIKSVGISVDDKDQPYCPRDVKFTAGIVTNQPGKIRFRVMSNRGIIGKVRTLKIDRQNESATLYSKAHFFTRNIDQLKGVKEIWFEANSARSRAVSAKVPFNTKCLRVLGGSIKFTDQTHNRCPRKLTAALEMTTNIAAPVPYLLKCNNGETFKGRAKPQGGNKAVASLQIKALKAGKLACTLNSRQPMAKKLITLAGHDVTCQQATGGGLTIVDQGGRCPRQGTLKVRVEGDTRKAPLPYQVICSDGQKFTGQVSALASAGSGKYYGQTSHKLKLKAPGQLSCVLKGRAPLSSTVLGVRGHQVYCRNRDIPTSGDGLTSPVNPPRGQNTRGKDRVKIAPPPQRSRLTCTGGKKLRGKCHCPAGHKLKRVKKNSYKCVAVPKPPKTGKTSGSGAVRTNPKKIKCHSGKKVRGKCICPAGKRLKKLKPQVYKCIKKAAKRANGKKIIGTRKTASSNKKRPKNFVPLPYPN